MKHWFLICTAAVGVLVAACIHDQPASSRNIACLHGSYEGKVDGSDGNRERHPCGGVLRRGTLLYQGDRLTTHTPGSLDFHTNHLQSCSMLRRSRDVILPRDGIALEHLQGKIICDQANGVHHTLHAAGAVIRLGAKAPGRTVLELVGGRHKGTVKVVHGEVSVSSGPGTPTKVGAGKQLPIPLKKHKPKKPRPLVLNRAERQAVTLLQEDVPKVELQDVPEAFTSLGEKTGVLVAENATILRIVKNQLAAKQIDVTGFTREQYLNDPKIRQQIAQLNPRVCVVAGNFDTMRPVIEQLRGDLGRATTIVLTKVVAPDLFVVIRMVNDNGGQAAASAFTVTVRAGNPSRPGFPGIESGTDVLLDPGSYSVEETGPSSYAISMSADCSGTIAIGEIKTCTITNDDKPGHLVVVTHVVNDNGGTAVPGNVTVNVNATSPSPGSFAGSATGTDVTLNAGNYAVDPTSLPGYAMTKSLDCASTVANGETKTCTITYDDQPGHLLVIKHVINDNGGGLVASQFVLNVTGVNASPTQFFGSETGTDVTLDPGPYSVEENGQAQYIESKSADCSGTIALGESKTCTITNDDVINADP